MKLPITLLSLLMVTSCLPSGTVTMIDHQRSVDDAGAVARPSADGGALNTARFDAGTRQVEDAGQPGCFHDADCPANFHCKPNGELAGECIADPGTCRHTTCGTSCGTIADVCGGSIACGACACVKGICGSSCGLISDGCGGTLNCGSCQACVHTTCGASCGEITDVCGGTIDCGTCPTCAQTTAKYHNRSQQDFTDPAICSGCPGAVLGFTELSSTLPAGATTVSLRGTVPGAQTCCWGVEGENGGVSSGSVTPDAAGTLASTLPVFCGKNTVSLICGNGLGARVMVREVTAPCQPKDLRLTLGWDDQGTDMELHLIRDVGHINSSLDCTWYTCVNRNIGWSATLASNPTKDVDNTSYNGPENIFLDTAEPVKYHVLVEYWGSGQPSLNTLTVALKDKTVGTISRRLQVHDVWYVGTVTFPGGAIAAVDTVTSCTEHWRQTTHGCDLPLP